MTLEEVENILWNGTKEQMETLAGLSVSFSYGPKSGGFSVDYGQEAIRAHGAYPPPNCVKFFGNEHKF